MTPKATSPPATTHPYSSSSVESWTPCPGRRKRSWPAFTNATKRKAVDDLLTKAGAYLHSGRHVSQAGADAGEFPVDRIDAGLALDLMRVLLSHLSLILGAEVRRSES